MKPLTLGLMLAIAALPASAEIYKFVDENGRVTYTNIPKKGATKLDVGGSSPASKTNKGPSSFPKVDSQTQKKRDDMRREILEGELESEQKALSDAQKALRDGEAARLPDETANPQKYLERVKRLRENVNSHERNVAALKKELGDFK